MAEEKALSNVSSASTFFKLLSNETIKRKVVPAALLLLFAYVIKRKLTDRKNGLKEFSYLPGKLPFVGHAMKLNDHGGFLLDHLYNLSLQQLTYRYALPFVPDTIMTSDPLVIQRFISTGFKEGVYEKSPQTLRQYKEFLGKGIFLSNGKRWQMQRNTASPLFQKHNLKTYVSLFLRNAHHLIANFQKMIQENEKKGFGSIEIDFQDYFMRYTLDSFCELGFGVNINSIESTDSAVKFQKAFDYVQTYTENRFRTGELWRVTEIFFKDANFHSHLKYMDDFITSIIDRRRMESIEELSSKSDLLSLLLLQNAKGEENWNDQDIRDWVMNFLIAGRDTTAITLTWCTYLLSKPENQFASENVIEEICNLLQINRENFNSTNLTFDFLNENISFDFQKNQKYLHKVLQETLRLYPPVPIDGFGAIKDDVVTTTDGKKYKIKKGTICLYSAYTTHRQPFLFENPERFDPDRFSRSIVPFSFVPFHGGPRLCLGQEMAYIEAKILLTCLLSQFKFELSPNANVVPKQALILTALNGVTMTLSPRL